MIDDYEEFSENQVKILNKFFTNVQSNIFACRNLPEVIKGALFSRYSRSRLGLRSLFLKEFVINEETAFSHISGYDPKQIADQSELDEQMIAIQKAQKFYDRILDGYGDDSVGELGGAHLAIENVSLLAAKIIEDARIGGSPLEKSTRYVYFDQKFKGDYLFYREPVLMTSAYRDLYLTTCNRLFDTYSKILPGVTAIIEKKFPQDPSVSSTAYTAALRAKVLDCIRGLLPASTLTNLGIYGNGRFFETLIQTLNCNHLSEIQDIGKKSYKELSQVIPSFIRRAEISHKHQKSYSHFMDQMQGHLKKFSQENIKHLEKMDIQGVKLTHYDSESLYRVAAALLFRYGNSSLLELENYCRTLPEKELNQIFDIAAQFRDNRRHKSPRALEHAFFTFEILSDFGVYRDLQRHRMLTQERQLLTCDLGYQIPEEIKGTSLEKDYVDAMEEAKKTYHLISQELPEEAQYVVPQGYNIHWYFHINLRALQWLCELRSTPAGHPGYRLIAQEMAKQVCCVLPQFERFFKFVDFEGYDLGRLGQEIRTDQKKQHVNNLL